MYLNSGARTEADPQFAAALRGTGVEARRLVDQAHGGSIRGKVGSIAISAGGAALFVPGSDAEQALFVLNGSGSAAIHGASKLIFAGDTLYVPAGRFTEIRADADMLRLLLIHRGSPQADGFGKTLAETRGSPIRIVSLEQIPNAAVHNPALGFLNMAARWLVNAELVQSRELIVGQSTFEPGAEHMLHRHDRAEEFFCIIEGEGSHLVEGSEVAMGPGDIVFTPRNEWLGFRNPHRVPVRALFGYFGAGHLDDGGYELRQA